MAGVVDFELNGAPVSQRGGEPLAIVDVVYQARKALDDVGENPCKVDANALVQIENLVSFERVLWSRLCCGATKAGRAKQDFLDGGQSAHVGLLRPTTRADKRRRPLMRENGAMMEAIVISGSDPRLESEIETARDDALHFKAVAEGDHYAVYGPYIALPTGRYRIELELTVDARAPGRVAIELCHSGARVRLYERSCFEWELTRGFIRISYPFEQGVENLEVRLRVPDGFAGSVRQLSFQRLADEPS